MKAMQCELCGSSEIVKEGDLFVCQSCGMKYTLENAKKMMIEGVVQVEGTVETDRSSDAKRFMELARMAKNGKNYQEAEHYATKALEIDQDNAEAWAIRSMSIDWQLTLKKDRLKESQAASLKMFELLNAKKLSAGNFNSDHVSLLLDYAEHVATITIPEINLFTSPIKSDLGTSSVEFITNDLLFHLKYRAVQLKAVANLCKIMLGTTDTVENSDSKGTPSQLKSLNDLSQMIPDIYATAAKDIADAAIEGYNKFFETNWKLSVIDGKQALVTVVDIYVGPADANKSNETDTFLQFSNASDNFIEVMIAAASLFDELSDVDLTKYEKLLFSIWKNVCAAEESNIIHRTLRRYHYGGQERMTHDGVFYNDEEKRLKNKKLKEYQEKRDSYDPIKKIKKAAEEAQQQHEKTLRSLETKLQKELEAAENRFWEANPEMKSRHSELKQTIHDLKLETDDLDSRITLLPFFKRKQKEELSQQLAAKKRQLNDAKTDLSTINSALAEYLDSQEQIKNLNSHLKKLSSIEIPTL